VLIAHRDRLAKAINQLTVPLKELESVGLDDEVKMLQEVQETAVKHLEEALEKVEKQIQAKLKEDPQIHQLYKYADSVCGVGMVKAVKMLVYTQGFTRLTDPAKLASYCGVAPFAHESGSTVKKRSRTHFMANKDLKCVLTMGARPAMRHDPEIKAYAERKTKEWKSYAWIKTAVCNKLLKRVLSCVNNQKYYAKSKFINSEVSCAMHNYKRIMELP
jgi:transposase